MVFKYTFQYFFFQDHFFLLDLCLNLEGKKHWEAGKVTAYTGLGLVFHFDSSFSPWSEAQGGAPPGTSFTTMGILGERLVTQMPRMGTHMTPMTSVTQRRKCLKVRRCLKIIPY